MKIPFVFYFKYWLKNSIMAFTLGCVIGFLTAWNIIRIAYPYPNRGVIIDTFFLSSIKITFPPYINNVTIASTLFFLVYQILVYRYFWGKRRGKFEYNYKKVLIDKSVKSLIIKMYGSISYLRYYLDGFSNKELYQELICKKLLNNVLVKNKKKNLFPVYVKLASISLKYEDFSREIELLLLSITIKPDDFISNYKLALSYERNGSADNAIKHYKAALNDPDINKTFFNDFIVSQIDRVNTNGTMEKPPSLD